MGQISMKISALPGSVLSENQQTDDKVDFIIRSVDELARNPGPMMQAYMCDPKTARFRAEGAPGMGGR